MVTSPFAGFRSQCGEFGKSAALAVQRSAMPPVACNTFGSGRFAELPVTRQGLPAYGPRRREILSAPACGSQAAAYINANDNDTKHRRGAFDLAHERMFDFMYAYLTALAQQSKTRSDALRRKLQPIPAYVQANYGKHWS